MPTVTLYHLAPRVGLHLGERGVEQEETRVSVPSDTLYSALYSAWLEAHGNGAEWDGLFSQPERAPFLIGSAFPRAGAVRFYPLPRVNLSAYGLGLGSPKALKRIAYVSEGVWERIAAGRSLASVSPLERESAGVLLQGGALWLTRDEVDGLPAHIREMGGRLGGRRARPVEALQHLHVYRTHKAPRVTVSRVTQAGSIYHTGRCVVAPDCGLWFPVIWRSGEKGAAAGDLSREGLELALALLCDAGIGGERAAGLGACSWSVGAEVRWQAAQAGQPAALLSRYHPREEELPMAIQGPHVRYALTSVAGYLRSPQAVAQRRRRLWLFSEGSVVTATAEVMGDVTDVRPLVGDFPHPVWRCGLALLAPLEVPYG